MPHCHHWPRTVILLLAISVFIRAFYLGSSRVPFAFPSPVGRLLNRMRTLTVRFIIFIFGAALVCAALMVAAHRRVLALTAEKPFAQYSHSVWRTENGLPQNTVRAI